MDAAISPHTLIAARSSSAPPLLIVDGRTTPKRGLGWFIVRAADTGHPESSPEAHGLLGLSTGLSRLHRDDSTMLGYGMHVYDALYRWRQESPPESETRHLRACHSTNTRKGRD